MVGSEKASFLHECVSGKGPGAHWLALALTLTTNTRVNIVDKSEPTTKCGREVKRYSPPLNMVSLLKRIIIIIITIIIIFSSHERNV